MVKKFNSIRIVNRTYLFNSNKDATNFLFRINGLSNESIAEFNTKRRFSEKFDVLYENGGTITFDSIVNETFRNNLIYVDSDLQRIFASCLVQYYNHSGQSIADVVETIEKENPCGYPTTMDFYAHKIKQILLVFALGMTATKPWSGQYDANGGYIVVKEDGDVVCYHFFDKNELENYLYNNTCFETPSTTRHQFGNIYEKDGIYWLKLNLQIRFIH